MDSAPATIVDTYLGYWIDDILVAFLLLEFENGLQRAVGGNLLNSRDPETNRSYGDEFALQLMRACGAQSWHELPGRVIEILFDAPFPWAQAIGVQGDSADETSPFLFAQVQPGARSHAQALRELGVAAVLRPPVVAGPRLR